MKTQQPSALLIVLAFLAIYIVWGTTYLAILFGLEGFPAFILSAFRFFIAGIILFICCKARNEKLPPKNIIWVCTVSGCLMLIGGSGLVTWAEKYVSSGHAAIITATEPFWFLLLDKKRWKFYFSNKLIATGLVIGFIGIILFFRYAFHSADSSTPNSALVIANIVLIISTILWVVGSLYSKNKLNNGDSNFMTTSLQLIAAGVGSGFIGLFTGEWNHFSFATISLNAWGGLLYLIVMGSLVAYLAFTWLISIRPPALVSTHTYINPIVAIIIGWLVANEKLSTWQIVALAIILAGMLLTNLPKYKAAGEQD